MQIKFRSFLPLAGTLSLMLAVAAVADPVRSPVTGVPRVQGREIPQFVLTGYVRMKSAVEGGPSTVTAFVMMPGQFVAASEDSTGVYYQAAKGFRMVNDPSQVVDGGVFVPRTGTYAMTVYLGDARNLGTPVRLLNHHPMLVEDMKKFQIVKVVSAKAPKK